MQKTNQLFLDELQAHITPGPLYLSHFQQADQGTDDKLHRGTWTSVDHSET